MAGIDGNQNEITVSAGVGTVYQIGLARKTPSLVSMEKVAVETVASVESASPIETKRKMPSQLSSQALMGLSDHFVEILLYSC
jgi:hypothetical protein